MIEAAGTNTTWASGKQTGSEKADASNDMENGTEDGEWEGFRDRGSSQENVGWKQKKNNKKKRQKPSTRDKAMFTAENSFATLEDAADNKVNGRSCTLSTWWDITKDIPSICLTVSQPIIWGSIMHLEDQIY